MEFRILYDDGEKIWLDEEIHLNLERAVKSALAKGIPFKIFKEVRWQITDPSTGALHFPNFGLGVNNGK